MENDQILQRVQLLKKQSFAFLILMLAGLGCAVYLYVKLTESEKRLEKSNSDLVIARQHQDSIKQVLAGLLSAVQPQISKSNTALGDSISRIVAQSKYTSYLVYLHRKGDQGKEITRQIMNGLKRKGFNVPGIQPVNRDFNRVFYFNDKDKPVAEELGIMLEEFLEQAGRSLPPDFAISKPDVKAPAGQFEIWLNLPDAPPPTTGTEKKQWIIIAGGSADKQVVQRQIDQFKTIGLNAEIYKKRNSWRTVVGIYESNVQASNDLKKVQKNGVPNAYLVQLGSWCPNFTVVDSCKVCQ